MAHESPGDFTVALEALTPELLRIDRRDLVPVNLDISSAVVSALGVVPKLADLRPAMVEWFGEEMATNVERLEPAARAAWQAHSRYGAVLDGVDIARLSAAALEHRTILLAEIQSLVARKVLPATATDSLLGPHGFKNQCFDLLRLASALQLHWETVEPQTVLTLEAVTRAEQLASQLASAVGIREQAGTSPAADLRQRAFTHFVRTYNQIRRMLAFLRFDEGDAEAIAPSLWTGRRGKRKRDEAPVEMPTTVDPNIALEPGTPSATPSLAPSPRL